MEKICFRSDDFHNLANKILDFMRIMQHFWTWNSSQIAILKVKQLSASTQIEESDLLILKTNIE